MQVRRVAGDLQLAADNRRSRVTEIDDEQGIRLAERHHIRLRAEEAHGLDLLAGAQPIDLSDLHQLIALGSQHSHRR